MDELCRYFLRLGSLGIGGPIALFGYMQRDLLEKRRWFGKDDFREGLALSQLAPGLMTFAILFRVKRLPEPLAIVAAGVIGFMIHTY
jgi:chromate transport protein ChrA